MSEVTKTSVKWLVGGALGALFVWLAALDWPLDRLFGAGLSLSGTVLSSGDAWAFDLVYLLPYFGVLTAIHFLRVIRWYPLLRPIADVGFARLNRVSAVGFMYLFLLPLRLGELARPYLIADRGDIKMAQAMATVVIERVVDGLIVSVVLFGVLFYLPGRGQAGFDEIQLGAWLALAVFSGALVVLLVAWWYRAWALNTIEALLGLASKGLARKVRNLLETFFEGLEALPHPRYFWQFTACSLVYWGLNGYGYYVLALGFQGLDLPLLAAYAMMCCVVVGMMLPNPPGNVGVFWYFLLKPLTLYGVAVGDPTATAFGLTAWLGQLVQQTGFGLWFTLRRDDSVPETTRGPARSRRVATDPP